MRFQCPQGFDSARDGNVRVANQANLVGLIDPSTGYYPRLLNEKISNPKDNARVTAPLDLRLPILERPPPTHEKTATEHPLGFV